MSQDICVVVPTIREYECVRAYVENARQHDFEVDRLFFLLVTENFCETGAMERMLDDLGVAGAVYDGAAREAWYDEHGVAAYSHVVPAASHAETSFGLLYMWADPRYELGVFIDDDTLPYPGFDFFGRHLRNLGFAGEVEAVRSDERWVNVLYQGYDDLYPRGYPYAAMDETVETDTATVERGAVVASQGLWTNVPDLDAVRILMDGDLQGQAQTRTDADDFERDFVAARDNYLTVCSMNLAFRREVIPAFYQFPMDDNEWDVGRFDDIWSGVVLKRACDRLGGRIYNGFPLCEHNKAPRSTFDDLTNEVHGLELNEHFWEIVDDAEPTTRGDGQAAAPDDARANSDTDADGVADADAYAAVARGIADALAEGDFSAYNNGAFLTHCGEYLRDWLACLDAVAASERVTAVADD